MYIFKYETNAIVRVHVCSTIVGFLVAFRRGILPSTGDREIIVFFRASSPRASFLDFECMITNWRVSFGVEVDLWMFRFLLYEFIQMRHTAELGLLKHLKLEYTSHNLHVATNSLISRLKDASTSRSSVQPIVFKRIAVIVTVIHAYLTMSDSIGYLNSHKNVWKFILGGCQSYSCQNYLLINGHGFEKNMMDQSIAMELKVV